MLFSVIILPHIRAKIKSEAIKRKNVLLFLKNNIDKRAIIGYNRYVVKIQYAGVAQSVVQLIRNQQVVCSSHITSSKNASQ